jgi:hypothetical protein
MIACSASVECGGTRSSRRSEIPVVAVTACLLPLANCTTRARAKKGARRRPALFGYATAFSPFNLSIRSAMSRACFTDSMYARCSAARSSSGSVGVGLLYPASSQM